MKYSADRDYKFFLDNSEELYKKYGHKYLAIKNGEILGSYDNCEVAVEETMKTEPLGSFIVQECSADSSTYICSIMHLCVY